MPPLYWVSQSRSIGVSFVFPGLHSIWFIGFGFLDGVSAPSSLFCHQARLLDISLAFFGVCSIVHFPNSVLLEAIIFAGRSQWPSEPIGIFYWPPCLYRMFS